MTSDLDRLMAVMEASFDPHYREAWTRRQVEDSLALPSTYMILIDADGREFADDGATVAAGFVLARQAADEVELLLIAVLPDHRGKSFGRRLLELFLDSAKSRGAAKVFLEMRANNPARSLYLAAGYEQIGLRKDYYRTITGATLDAMTFGREI